MQDGLDTPALARRQHDLLDQRPNELHRLILVRRVLKQALQRLDFLAVHGRKVRMHRDVRGDRSRRSLSREARLLAFEFGQPGLHGRLIQPVLDRSHDAVDLASGGHELRLDLRGPAACLLSQAIHLFLIGAGELCH
ncbi:hypothetical protein JH26_21345 [Microvirga sp. BSC39]|nr:hypothetical protein JH26_21345 [Microvirga sp. BSC39]